MRFKFSIIPAVLLFQAAVAQNNPASLAQSPGTSTAPVSPASSGSVTITDATPSPASSASNETLIVDYKSVYDSPTVEEEVKMAADRFNLTKSQQDVWLSAASDRRLVENQVRGKLESNAPLYEKDPAYRGLRSAQNTFYETIIGYLSPAQKQSLETDRAILQEKQKRLAKLPPAAPTPTVTVAPVDSATIKPVEKSKSKSKKTKKKA